MRLNFFFFLKTIILASLFSKNKINRMTSIKKVLGIFVILLFTTQAFSQTIFQGTIKDASSKAPLPFCHIVNKTNKKVSLSNEDGTFRIAIKSSKDSLLVTFVGYQTTIIAIKDFPSNNNLLLQPSSISFNEVVVTTGENYLYELLERCIKKMQKGKASSARTYLQVETVSKEEKKPLEMIQCYYNGFFNGATIDYLSLKSGRVGLVNDDSSSFVSLGTTQALARLNLLVESKSYPSTPLQFKGKKLRKTFELKRLNTFEKEKIIQVAYFPLIDGEYFEGEVWIHETTASLLKITLKRKDAKAHPFVPIHKGSRIAKIDLDITQTFQFNSKKSILSHINLDYDLVFMHKLPTGYRIMEVETESLLHFYDYGNLMTLPFYDYSMNHDDYRKISFFPYNDAFWEHNVGVTFSKKELEKLAFLEKEGTLLNFDKSFNNKPFFEFNNMHWSKKKRISVKNISSLGFFSSSGRVDILGATHVDIGSSLPKANFVVQLYLDINTIADTLNYHSATIFDVFQSYSNLRPSDTTDCFVNIYFDLCELERQRLINELKTRDYSIAQAIKAYRKSEVRLNTMTRKYFKSTSYGQYLKGLEKWNDKVNKALGIDNMMLFGLNKSND